MILRGAWEVSVKQRDSRGQALIELAVFGTIFLLILGAMITYGLNYNYNQEAQMKAFRTALKIASSETPGTQADEPGRKDGSYMVLQERHIPDPMNPHGAGSAVTVMASASVTRDHQLYVPGDSREDLPGVLFDYQVRGGNKEDDVVRSVVYRTAGFRIERIPLTLSDPNQPEPDPVPTDDDILPVDDDLVDPHHPEPPDVVNCDPNSPDYNADACVATPSGPTQEELRDRLMMKYQIIYGGVVDVGLEETGTKTGVLRITDACAGEVIEYEACYQQALKIIDRGYCERSCARSLPDDSEYTCYEICSMTTNPPNQNSKSYNASRGGAWYAANWEGLGAQAPDPDHRYRFPILEGLFTQEDLEVNKSAHMGLQSSPSTRTTRSTQTRRVETTDAITTEDQAQWTTATERPFIWNRNLDASGYDINRTTAEGYLGHTSQVPMNSTWVGEMREAWNTVK